MKGEVVLPFDYKKEFKEFYLPPAKPGIVTVPPMNFVAVRGSGDPNREGGEYQQAMGLLYGVSFTLKMCDKAGYAIKDAFPYVVPPLEGLWWQEGQARVDFSDKEHFQWISLIRLPDFVTRADFDWAVAEATRKKKQDYARAEFLTYDEGLCVQCMHLGAYDDEPATIAAMDAFAEEQGYALDLSDERRHHEIYLSDPRRCAPEKLRTVIRHPVKKEEGR